MIRKLKVARESIKSLGVVGLSESLRRGSEAGVSEGPDPWRQGWEEMELVV